MSAWRTVEVENGLIVLTPFQVGERLGGWARGRRTAGAALANGLTFPNRVRGITTTGSSRNNEKGA